MSESHPSSSGSGLLLPAILLIVVAYLISAVYGIPQHGTALILEGQHHGEHEDEHPEDNPDGHQHEDGHENGSDSGKNHGKEGENPPPGEKKLSKNGQPLTPTAAHRHPPLFTVTPFVLLLLAIAILPLLHFTEHWWESNLHRLYVAGALGLATLTWYLLWCSTPVDKHWLVHGKVAPQEGLNWEIVRTVLENAVLNEYVPFIMLLFSLYTISGGIRIAGDLPAHPWTNTKFIGAGGLLASFIGTTGAAMLLIRPLLATNSERRHVRHTVIFFIFVACNCGGCLLPIGDPPLFLGYLRGVDFFWTLNLWAPWAAVNLILLVLYFLVDYFWLYPSETVKDIAKDETRVTKLTWTGKINFVWLLGVVAAVAFLDPSKPVPGTQWHPWVYLREVVQLGLVALSLWTTPQGLRKANNFNYAAILEVAALFIGIFICMQPALQILHVKGPQMALDAPWKFFWATGSLSAVLDNAPTYVVFFETASSLPKSSDVTVVANVAEPLLVAISLGSVFMGAMTYIGNGPNFMVKAIAEKEGVQMPSFFGYMVYSVIILLPIFIGLTVVLSLFRLW